MGSSVAYSMQLQLSKHAMIILQPPQQQQHLQQLQHKQPQQAVPVLLLVVISRGFLVCSLSPTRESPTPIAQLMVALINRGARLLQTCSATMFLVTGVTVEPHVLVPQR